MTMTPASKGIAYRAVLLQLAVDQDLPGIGGLITRENADKRRFSRAIFAHQAVHGALLHGEGDVGERLHAGISLGYRVELKEVLHLSTPEKKPGGPKAFNCAAGVISSWEDDYSMPRSLRTVS